MLRPLDMTQTIQQQPELNRTHSNENRPEAVQQQFADKMNKEVRQNDQQVMQTNKTEENRVDRDGRSGGGGGGSRKRNKGKEAKADKPKAQRSGGGSMFDISI